MNTELNVFLLVLKAEQLSLQLFLY